MGFDISCFISCTIFADYIPSYGKENKEIKGKDARARSPSVRGIKSMLTNVIENSDSINTSDTVITSNNNGVTYQSINETNKLSNILMTKIIRT